MNTAAVIAGETVVTQRNAMNTHRRRLMKPPGTRAMQARGVQPQGSAEDAAGAGDQPELIYHYDAPLAGAKQHLQ